MNRRRLDVSAGEAVLRSRQALADTQGAAVVLIGEMDSIAKRLGSPEPESASGQFISLVKERVAEIERLFEKQKSVADSFNIVLFGRTGAGKSTLVESLTKGNGAAVSHGESDWTTDVEPKYWESCKVYDTPGINGWGRNNKRSDLEQRARNAAEVADFVIVCFDSQSQQATEFTKVASWVHQFNKPVIAVLNARNAVWRVPPRVPIGAARANASRAVAEHAGNIQDELAAVGLTGVPVVAISSKRSLFARASVPYKGPDTESFEFQRATYGVEKLEEWSNFHALEGLVTRCIEDHAIALRLGTLHDQLRGVLDALAEGMTTTAKAAAEEAAVIESQTIESLLKLLGYPISELQRKAYVIDGLDRLMALENMRGTFQAPSFGEFSHFVRQRLSAEFGALRSRSLADAEETVAQAFDRGVRITSDDVKSRCFRMSDIEAKAKLVLEEAHDFISRRASLAYRDSFAELKARIHKSSDVDGEAGVGLKYGSWGLKSAGVLSGVAAALGGLAVANFWNPFGWAAGLAGAVAGVGALVASLFGWLGGKARTSAEERRLKARSEALANIRRNVYAFYEDFSERIILETTKIATNASGQVVIPAIDLAMDLRNLESASTSLNSKIISMMRALPSKADPQRLVWEAKESCEQEAEPGSPDASSRHWLGEAWIDNPEGLEKQYHGGEHRPTPANDPGLIEGLFTSFKQVWSQVTSGVSPGSGSRWFSKVRQKLADDDLAQPALKELEAILVRGRPRIHLVGDYNAGKSSFIKRLLLDAGQAVPRDLRIRANPTTDKEHVYEWAKIDLVDTPGFQSANTSHTEVALHSFSDASAIFYLFQPNLLTGDDSAVQLVLKGDRHQGLVPKSLRTFYIVNRADELGVDPVENLRRYKELSGKKRRELSEALASRGVVVEPSRVMCMASDPFGLVGDRDDATSESFDSHRSWDGFNQFMRAFRDVEAEVLRIGVDRSVLEGGLARLARLDLRRATELSDLTRQRDALERMRTLVLEQRGEGLRLVDEHRARLTRLVEEQAAILKEDLLQEMDPNQLKLKSERAQKWWEDKAFTVELEQWGKEAQKDLEGWRIRTEEAIHRRLTSAEFRGVFGEPTLQGAPGAPSNQQGKAWYQDAFDKVGRVMGGATRDVVYKVGKSLGFKFKPWGAVKIARGLSKAGAIMGVVGVVWDIADLMLEERRLDNREQAKGKFTVWLGETIPIIVRTVAEGDEREPGLIKVAETYLEQLMSQVSGLETECINKTSEMDAVRVRRVTYGELQVEAVRLLGNTIWEEI